MESNYLMSMYQHNNTRCLWTKEPEVDRWQPRVAYIYINLKDFLRTAIKSLLLIEIGRDRDKFMFTVVSKNPRVVKTWLSYLYDGIYSEHNGLPIPWYYFQVAICNTFKLIYLLLITIICISISYTECWEYFSILENSP